MAKKIVETAEKSKVKRKKRPLFRGEPCEQGARLLAALASRGLNGRDLAKHCGVSEVTVHRWLIGECAMGYLARGKARELLGADVC